MSEDLNETVYGKAIREIAAEIIKGVKGGSSTLQPFAKRIIELKMDEIVHEGKLAHLMSPGESEISPEYATWLSVRMNETLNTLGESLLQFSDVKDALYNKSYEGIKSSEQHQNWVEVFCNEIFSDENSLNEIFVRLVEEQQGVEVTSAKQLQELTGIKELWGLEWKEGDKEPPKKERERMAKEDVENCFNRAMSYRYSKTLEGILKAGGKYKDLLLITPKDFNLPETWSGSLTTDQYSSILWAIEDTFLIGETQSIIRPDLKTIAQDLEAPYSVLMDVHKICNQWKLQS